jgi:hypothetical protein
MRLVVVSLVFCAVAFSQSAPDNNLQDFFAKRFAKRLESMKLPNGPALTGKPAALAHAPEVCAIPLLNALPARSSGDYKIRIVKPNVPAGQMAGDAPSHLGIPACK